MEDIMIQIPLGFRLAAANADFRNKKLDRNDLALVVSDVPAAAAGVFTTNLFKAAPVLVSQAHLEAAGTEGVRAILINSGQANACTGEQGLRDAERMAVLTEEVGELARIMARTYGDQSFKEGEKHDLSDEMADILWVLVCLANQTGVDLTTAFQKNLEKKTSRDKERHKNNTKL